MHFWLPNTKACRAWASVMLANVSRIAAVAGIAPREARGSRRAVATGVGSHQVPPHCAKAHNICLLGVTLPTTPACLPIPLDILQASRPRVLIAFLDHTKARKAKDTDRASSVIKNGNLKSLPGRLVYSGEARAIPLQAGWWAR